MMRSISLPLWAFLLLVAFAGWAMLDRLLLPSVRFVLRQRTNRVIEELNRRLSIRIQPFKLTKRRVLIDRLVFDPDVMAAVEAIATAERTPREVVVAKVERYAREIVPSFNAWIYFRFGYRIARAFGRLLYRVRLGSINEAALAEIPEGATVVFVMNHRSNMDYVLVAYLIADRAALSYAVGEWARIWPLESLIKGMGAYFVRRGSKNPLYRKVLERYVAMATAEGVTQAVYPEGGLSRDGRLRPPKLGIFDYVLRGFEPNAARDVVFVPVGLNYDRVLEDRTLLLDVPSADSSTQGPDHSSDKMPPAPRRSALPTTLSFIGRNLRLMALNRWHRFGYACVNFGQPLSLRAFVGERDVRPRELDRDARFELTKELATELMTRIGAVVPVVPVALAAAVFVDHPDQSLSALEFKGLAFAKLTELNAAGARVYIPRRDQDYALEVGLRQLRLRHILEENDGLFKVRPSELHLLRYYANSIEHLLPSQRDEA